MMHRLDGGALGILEGPAMFARQGGNENQWDCSQS